MNINCNSHIAMVKGFLPRLIKLKSTGTQIVNILSVSGLVGNPMRTMYCASKHGLSGFGKALRAEVKPHGVHVLNVYPTYV
mmetsp:Transcript_71401/g.98864  ORF Transcript_71401/g.98864 Transcript_71401/m.98864 type:complete len:81 (-) Transcript_71401:277-519(-)